TMTFTTEQTYSDVGGTGRTLTTNYGTPTFYVSRSLHGVVQICAATKRAAPIGVPLDLLESLTIKVRLSSRIACNNQRRGLHEGNGGKCRCSVICGQSPARSTNIAVGLFSRERHGDVESGAVWIER